MIRHLPHARCFACGPENDAGLRLAFELWPDKSLCCRALLPARFDGYSQLLHSGVVATLLDSAMAHCLFALGLAAHAHEITVRHLAPVLSGREVVLKARFLRERFPVYVLEAQLVQDGQRRASAKGSYSRQPRVASGPAGVRAGHEDP